ncbi:MAG TPA: DNA primase [Lachnospiraceae bacterium]|nr:DNA primase [Lachnospiraceae bacterium]
MYYSDELVEEVRTRNDIVDVVSSYVRMKKKGSNYVGLCPFHSEKTGSFMVNPSMQIYKCFGCNKGGNVFSFMMEYEGLTFPEAVKVLAERAGIDLPETSGEDKAKAAERHRKKERLFEMNKEAATFFYYQLRKENGKAGLSYFKKRELSDETMKKFGLGFANVTSNDLCLYLKNKGYSDEEIVEAGLAVNSEKRGMSDKFWNRVMFPIQDLSNKVIGFGGRVLGDGEPKYLNSPDTPIFDKSRNLYGLNYARSAKKKHVILCEGYMDVISMHQAGFTEAVASLGTAFTSGQANLLKRYTENVILAYDSDEAGTKAALRAIGILRSVGLVGRILHLEPAKDPDEFIKRFGKDAFEERLENCEDSFIFEMRMTERDYDLKSPESKSRFRSALVEKLFLLKDNFDDVRPFIETAASKYGFDTDELVKSVAAYGNKVLSSPYYRREREYSGKKDAKKEDTRVLPYKLFFTLICDDPELYKKAKGYLSIGDFPQGLYEKAMLLIKEAIDEGKDPEPGRMISVLLSDESIPEEEASEINTLFTTRASDELHKFGGLSEDDIISGDIGEDPKEKGKILKELLIGIKSLRIEDLNATIKDHPENLNELIGEKHLLEKLQKAAF